MSCAIVPSGRPVITEKILCYCAKWPSEKKYKNSTVDFNSPKKFGIYLKKCWNNFILEKTKIWNGEILIEMI